MTVSAANLPFKIVGVQATEENIDSLVNQLKKIEGVSVSGKLAYSGGILTFEDFWLSVDRTINKEVGVDVDFSSASILLKGRNIIQSFVPFRLASSASLRVFGAGSLEVISAGGDSIPFIMGNNSTLKFMYTTLKVQSWAYSAFAGQNGDATTGTTLTFCNSDVDIEYSHIGSYDDYGIANINTLNIEYSDVNLLPKEENDEHNFALKIDSIHLAMAYLTGQNADQYVFSPTARTYEYGAWPVRKLTWTKDLNDMEHVVAVAGEINDSSEYAWSNGAQLRNDTLFLENANIFGNPGNPAITFFNKVGTICLKGENLLISNASATIFAYNSVHFDGDGSVRIVGEQDGLITHQSTWARSGNIQIVCGEYGIHNRNENAYESALLVSDADLHVLGQKKALFLNSSAANHGLELAEGGPVIVLPYDPSEVFDAKEVRFATPEWTADIYVAGNRINNFNYYHLDEMLGADTLKKDINRVSISYDRDKQELQFDNAWVIWLKETEDEPLFKILQPVSLVFISDCQFDMGFGSKSSKFMLIDDRDVTIEGKYGNNKLYVAGAYGTENVGAFAVMDGNSSLTFRDINVEAVDFNFGLMGLEGTDTHEVHFIDADVKLSAHQWVALQITDMTFERSRIAEPENAEFSRAARSFVVNDTPVYNGTVRIETYDEEGIEDVLGRQTDSRKMIIGGQLYIVDNNGKIYNAQGVEVK